MGSRTSSGSQYSLLLFHAVVQERRLYGPLGWNIPYEFSDSDLRISARQLQMFLNEYENVPFKALLYLTGECNYGGRVTDPVDRRLLSTLLADFYNEKCLYDHAFCEKYEAYDMPPAFATHEKYLDHVLGLPSISPPELFGLHANAGIAKERKEAFGLFEDVLRSRGEGIGGEGEDRREALVAELADDIQRKLPQEWDLSMVQRRFPLMHEESMNTVLGQELVRYNRMSRVMMDSMRDLTRALKGLLLMSAELEQAYVALSLNRRPELWRPSSYPSLKPLSGYIQDLTERLDFFQAWIDYGPPAVFWFSGFYFPQSFLTGGMQNFARRSHVPIDLVELDFEIPEDQQPEQRPEQGMCVRGLFLEGGAWDWGHKSLAEPRPKVLFTPAPLLHLLPKEPEDVSKYRHYNCPVYRIGSRCGELSSTGHSTNFVMWVRLPSILEKEAHWVKRGVAMLLQLND